MSENNVTTEKEIWKPVVGWESVYQVSSLGRVRRIGYSPLIGYMDVNGYPKVGLHRFGKRTTRFVHQLVCEAFVSARPIGMQVNHKNGIVNDNRPSNLEWVTRKENSRHAIVVLGRRVGGKRIPDDDVIEMRRLWGSGASKGLISRKFGVAWSTVHDIVRYRKRIHVI